MLILSMYFFFYVVFILWCLYFYYILALECLFIVSFFRSVTTSQSLYRLIMARSYAMQLGKPQTILTNNQLLYMYHNSTPLRAIHSSSNYAKYHKHHQLGMCCNCNSSHKFRSSMF